MRDAGKILGDEKMELRRRPLPVWGKRLLSLLLCFVLVQSLLSIPRFFTTDAAAPYTVPDMSGMNGEQIIKEIDQEMKQLYPGRVSSNFYWDHEWTGDLGLIRYDWLVEDLKRNANTYSLPVLFSPVVYNTSDSDLTPNLNITSVSPIGTYTHGYAGAGDQKIRAWGKDYAGRWYTDWDDDQAYWFDVGWSGYRLNGQFWSSSSPGATLLPYQQALNVMKTSDLKRYNEFAGSPFWGLTSITGFPDDLLEKLIQKGVDTIWAGKTGADVDFRSGSPFDQRRNAPVHNRGEAPPGGWTNYILVMVPPTYVSWGYGARFSADPNNANVIYEIDIPIAPIDMVLDDLEVHWKEPLPASVDPGEQVTLTVTVTSNFNRDVVPVYSWSLPGAGNVTDPNGEQPWITIPAMGTVDLSVTFTVPAGGLLAAFEVNPPDAQGYRGVTENGDYDNNKVEHFIATKAPPPMPGGTHIPAWVLTKELDFSLPSSTASLTLPKGSWDGNATGSLTVTNQSEDIYRNFAVSNNDPVDEASSTITRTPRIAAMLDRADFGDDPKSGHFAPNSPVFQTALIEGSGSVSRPYKYSTTKYRADGTSYTVSSSGTASADFSPINDEQTYIFDVYNGRAELPFRKVFDRKADRGAIEDNGVTYDLAWEGTPIEFDVVRWMCHRHADDSEYDWEAVAGQYTRTFIGQSTGSLTWSSTLTQAAGYESDRDNARNGLTGSNNYQNAVFATDPYLQSIPYPIKSGYYFNPVGAYTCTVVTKQYKDHIPDTATEEHMELVEKVTDAFHYSSELQYITASRDVTTLTDADPRKSVSNGNPRGILSVEPPETEIDVSDPLPTTLERTGSIDPLLEEVMEGYSNSMTEDSYSAYKYQERTDKEIYLVTETTVITFTLAAPESIGRIYTHVNMPNGGYRLRVWQEPFIFTGPSEKRANLPIPNSGFFDGLVATVRGSVYDDRR